MSDLRFEAAADTATKLPGWRLENSYATLPALFYADVEPTPVRAPRLVVMNRAVASKLGLEPAALEGENGAAIFAGNRLPPGARPIAQAYAGHQFGHFTGLGDGRAILLGEQVTHDGGRFDLQLKGSGPTPYSRRGDGRAALGPMLREYIISEAMHALGIPTTRSLAVVTTGEVVYREKELTGAVLTRVAVSHIRVGTFQWAAAAGGEEATRALVDYTIRRHYPELAEAENPALALLDGVVERQARLIAQWMLVGFIHGVMNTDNMAISGETIDYGPCAFVDVYDPATVFRSIDRHGRYAYANQPSIAQWNLARLAETLLPLIDVEEKRAVELATGVLGNFAKRYREYWLSGMRRKLGLFGAEAEDEVLVESLLAWMQQTRADFTNTFAELERELPDNGARRDDEEFVAWHARWRERLTRQRESAAESDQLRRANCPAFVPRNHQVEAAITAAEQGDLGVMDRLLDVLANPYEHERDAREYRQPAGDDGAGYRTFCGT